MRVPRTGADLMASRIWSRRYCQSVAVISSADAKTRALCLPRSWDGSSAYFSSFSCGTTPSSAWGDAEAWTSGAEPKATVGGPGPVVGGVPAGRGQDVPAATAVAEERSGDTAAVASPAHPASVAPGACAT